MKPATLIVVDDFAPEVDAVRKRALELPYETMEHHGNKYAGVGYGYDPQIEQLIAQVVGFHVKIGFGFFRLGMTGTKQTGYIHSDNCESEFAGVWYLNLPHQKHGGTAFWKHRATQVSEAPINGVGLSAEDRQQMLGDTWDESKWEMEMIVRMKYNRFIAYPSRCFHSRYPNNVQAKTKDEGRLVYATFFDRA